MANGNQSSLPADFVIDQPAQQELPQGFVLDSQHIEQIPQQSQNARTAGGRTGRAKQLRTSRIDTQNLTNKFEAGELSSSDLSPEQIDAIQKERVKRIPEISETGFKALSENQGFLQAMAGLTTFNEDEFGDILRQADPNIGVVTTPDGERIAVNNKTGDTVSINKLGPSLMDALQVGGAVAAFAPAGRLAGVPKIAGASALTQTGIESGQALAGGEFNPEEVLLAGAAVPVVSGVIKSAQSGINKVRSAIKAPSQPKTDFVPLFSRESTTKQKIRQAIEQDTGDNVTARYFINASNKVEKAPVAKAIDESVKQGLDDGTASLIVGSSKKDKEAISKMLDIMEKRKVNKRFAVDNRSSQVAGDTLKTRFKFVENVNRQAGKELNGVAKSLEGQQADLTLPVSKFSDDLNELGVSFDDAGKINFTDSIIEGSTGAENLLKKVWPRIQRLQNNPDAFKAHNLKRFIDTQVNFGKTSKDGLTNETERVVKELRRNINESLRELSPKYKEVNTRFSETRKAIDNFGKAAGTNFSPDKPSSNEFLGKLSRRLLSNVQSRETLSDSIYALESVGRKHGAKFGDDLKTQVAIIDEIETLFGSQASNSLQGVQEKAFTQAARAVTGQETAVGIAIKGGAKVIEKAQGINEKNAIKAIRALLKE